jgi:hypothetical protein
MDALFSFSFLTSKLPTAIECNSSIALIGMRLKYMPAGLRMAIFAYHSFQNESKYQLAGLVCQKNTLTKKKVFC